LAESNVLNDVLYRISSNINIAPLLSKYPCSNSNACWIVRGFSMKFMPIVLKYSLLIVKTKVYQERTFQSLYRGFFTCEEVEFWGILSFRANCKFVFRSLTQFLLFFFLYLRTFFLKSKIKLSINWCKCCEFCSAF